AAADQTRVRAPRLLTLADRVASEPARRQVAGVRAPVERRFNAVLVVDGDELVCPAVRLRPRSGRVALPDQHGHTERVDKIDIVAALVARELRRVLAVPAFVIRLSRDGDERLAVELEVSAP